MFTTSCGATSSLFSPSSNLSARQLHPASSGYAREPQQYPPWAGCRHSCLWPLFTKRASLRIGAWRRSRSVSCSLFIRQRVMNQRLDPDVPRSSSRPRANGKTISRPTGELAYNRSSSRLFQQESHVISGADDFQSLLLAHIFRSSLCSGRFLPAVPKDADLWPMPGRTARERNVRQR